ncbi:MAG TPA: ATP-binding protein [Bryobacteraceae bacterium]|nr:ATP-binding protein [Bryobacteraceae bacterium]
MLQELKFQLSTAILTVLTIAAAIAAALNYQQIHRFRLPDDGVTWVDHAASDGQSQVVALRVSANGPAERAGIRVGDVLKSIQAAPINDTSDVPRRLAYVGAWAKAAYVVRRVGAGGTVDVPASVIVGEAIRGIAITWQYVVGVAYLAIGLFVYFRRGSAYKARHFYIFCLVSFIFSCFHRTGKLNGFDQVIDWGNLIAGWLAPALFLHFCLTFPEPQGWFRRSTLKTRWSWITPAPLLYLPGAVLTLVAAGFAAGLLLSPGNSLLAVREALDRSWMGLLTATYLVSGAVLQAGYRKAEDPVIRQQLKWLRNGMLFGFAPFALLNAIPYVLDLPFSPWMNYAVVTLPLIPLTIAIAIVRYRLMDVDAIFRRGYAYTLSTLVLLALFYSLVFSLGSFVQKNFKNDPGNFGLIAVMLIATFLFQPLRNWIQERLDRFFYRDRYDYRRTLIEFARELNSETDLDPMLRSVAERLTQTLSIRHVAFFLADRIDATDPDPAASSWRLHMSLDSSALPLHSPGSLDLSFLDWQRTSPYIFFERTRYHLDAIAGTWPASVRQTIADLDLNYYLPCTVRGRTIAFLGASRTDKNEFLSSDDVELLQTLSNYVGIATENASLYRSLKQKVGEYERLKEFSENIVESINVGILAAGLDDRVESWNTQMERLSGIGRADAVGRTLAELFPATLVEQFELTRGERRIHHLDKFALDTRNGESSMNIAIAPLVSRDNEQIGRLVIFDDVTDRAELERRLVQADKLSSIGLLAAGVAHEVNTPLAVISTYAQMLAKQVAEDDQKSRILEKIARQTFRASEIVNSLLNFSRTSTSELTDVQLNRVIQETLSLLEHQLKKAGIEVRTKLDPNLDPVKGNSGKLQQVFLNLFLNARDAMSEQRDARGVLEVTTRTGERGTVVEVTDTGHGIAPEHLSRIYDPFFTTKSAKKGTGLGLSVTYGIIQEHHGAIEAVSRPGEGTCFHLEFPAISKTVHV